MEFGASLSYPFRNPRWVVRALVGAALEVLPILVALPLIPSLFRRHAEFRLPDLPLFGVALVAGLVCRFVILGYLARVARDALGGGGAGLPAWDRFEQDLVEGLKLWLLTIGLMLPALGITASLALLFGAIGLHAAAWLPFFALLPLLLVVTFFVLPAALVASVAEGEMTAAFDLRRVTGVIGVAFGPYVLAFVLALAVEIVAQLGLVLFCVGIFATRFLAHAIVVHAFASVYRQAAGATADAAVSV
jgi:Protein of unknown function (DUF4013)